MKFSDNVSESLLSGGFVTNQFQQFLQQWYLTSPGRSFYEQEQALVVRAIPNLFGFYLVQLGASYPPPDSMLESSRVQTKVLLDRQQTVYRQMLFVQADLDYLPIQKESVDVVFLPHTLETVADPYHVLREVDRILVAEGHVVITGFNPLGCRLLRWRLGKARENFKQANLMRMERVIDWLNLLAYDIELAEYSPMSCFGVSLNRLSLGDLFVVVARKREASPKPVGLNWKLANWLPVNKGVSISTSRQPHLKQRKNSHE